MATENEKPIEKPAGDKGETVPRETYEKTITEKKNAMKAIEEKDAKIAAYEAKLKESEELTLREKEDFKTLATNKEKEALDWKTKFESLQSKNSRGVKLSALTKELAKLGTVDEKAKEYVFKMVDLNNLKYDDEHELVTGAEDEAKRLYDALPQLFGKGGPTPNHDASKNGSGPKVKSIEEWTKLTPSERMKMPLADVYKNAGIKMNK